MGDASNRPPDQENSAPEHSLEARRVGAERYLLGKLDPGRPDFPSIAAQLHAQLKGATSDELDRVLAEKQRKIRTRAQPSDEELQALLAKKSPHASSR